MKAFGIALALLAFSHGTLAFAQVAQAGRPLAETGETTIEYPTVAAALKDLTSRPGANIRTINGWTVITDEKTLTIWSFAPVGNAAYPAVVKRWITSNGNGSDINMDVHCEASKSACDDLVRTFSQMNGLQLPR